MVWFGPQPSEHEPACAQMAKKAKGILACARNIQDWGNDCTSVLVTGEATPQILCSERAAKLVEGLEHKSYEEQLTELGLFVLEKRRLMGDFIAIHNCMKGGWARWGSVSSSK